MTLTEKKWQKINTWSIKGPLLLLAGLLGFLDHTLHWGRAVFAAGLAIVIVIVGFRAYWSQWNF